MGGAVGGVVVDEEHVAAKPVHVRSRHGQHRGHGDRRIHGVPPVLQHAQASLRSEGMARRHGTMFALRVASCFGVRGDDTARHGGGEENGDGERSDHHDDFLR